MTLKERYRNICNEYLQRFCIKQGYHYEPNDAWVAGEAGDCATIGDYVFGFDEIRYDIDNDVPKGKILAWYSYVLEIHTLGLPNTISYPSFCNGTPPPYSRDKIEEIRTLKKQVEQAEKTLKNCIDEASSNTYKRGL